VVFLPSLPANLRLSCNRLVGVACLTFMTRTRVRWSDRGVDASPHRWDGLVIICAANSYDGIKLADQHLAEHLSRHVPVLYVDPPVSPLTGIRSRTAARFIELPRLRSHAPGLVRLTPVVQPCPSRQGMTSITTALLRGYLHKAISRLGCRARAVISAWPHYPIFGSVGEQVSVYWAQDDFVGGASLLGFNARHLDACERRVSASADLVVASNPVVAATWRDRGHESILIPFGVDVAAYTGIEQAAPATDVDLPRPIVGFIGQINDRTDLRLLESIADRGRSVLLVGPKDPAFEPHRFDALRHRRNVVWVGPKPFDSLPSYLQLIDVGIVPYRDSAFNRGSFPLKTLEYLAAGRPVVATDLPAIRWLATDLVAIASEPGRFADHVDRMLNAPRSQALIDRRRSFAAEHSWTRRATDLNELLLSRCAPHHTMRL
jgi:teichuronic acid biosynthesis glycosyltransferase TuaH